MSTLFIFIIAFVVTFFLVPCFIYLAKKLNVIDNPDGRLKLQKAPVPYLGGVAVFLGFVATLIFFNIFQYDFESRFDKQLFFVATTILLIVGLVDDVKNLSPQIKFLGQSIAAVIYVKAGLYLHELHFPQLLNFSLSFFYFLSFINAFNLVDIMDGLSSTVAICSLVSFFIYSITFNLCFISMLIISLLGAILAFLIFNRPPQAKIYLGDSGSLFIGGVLSTLPFMIPIENYNKLGYLALLVPLFIPLLELLWLIVIRIYKGIPPYHGSPDHFAIYFQKYGWSKSKVLFYIIINSFILFFISWAYAINDISLMYFIVITLGYMVFWYVFLIKKALSKGLI